MIEKKTALIKILGGCNGSRKMLENILNEHPGMQIDKKLAEEITEGGMEKAEIYRRVTAGLGRPKSHCSQYLSKHEGELKNT